MFEVTLKAHRFEPLFVFSVVAADHEGRHSQFIAGYAAGMRVLDGVRALTNFKKLSSPQVAFVGYCECSQISSLNLLTHRTSSSAEDERHLLFVLIA